MGLLDWLGVSTKHKGQHEPGQHKAGKHTEKAVKKPPKKKKAT